MKSLKNRKYITLEDFLGQLEEACSDNLSIEKKYAILRSVFFHSIDQELADCKIAFAGMFAKVDYLMKEKSVPREIVRLIHNARRMMFPQRSQKVNPEDSDLATSFPHDLKATALLVSCLNDGVEIPQSVKGHYPKGDRTDRWSHFDENLVRVIVKSWDNERIYATAEENSDDVTISYGPDNVYLTREGKGDWSYLSKILCENAQLNLVRVRTKRDILYPELIIFEPDFLINISTIASCFETYAESPFVSLVNKLQPSESTIPIHMGNLAGQFLDNTVHRELTTFEDDFLNFFHHNALELIACEDMGDKAKVLDFYNNAKLQKRNIERLVGEELPVSVIGYDRKKVVLEPTFFSEVLGMQGRLDFLYEDENGTVIIEQKSGKGAYVPPNSAGYDPELPEIQEKHWVQLVLYRALLIYEFQKYSEQIRHIFLLYSKYAKGLVSMAQSPELMLRAIRMRNLIAWMEISYARDGMGLLKSLTPEKLNMKNITGRLWENYVRPKLSALLSPIHEASPLELAYYLRFLQFTEMEQMLSKVGNKVKECSGFASVWLNTLEDKNAAGNIYYGLTIKGFEIFGNAVESITLNFPADKSSDMSNFRIGDIVILYPYLYGCVPNACAQMVVRASIVDITNDDITLRLRNSQTDKLVFQSKEEMLWAIEHDMFESSSGSLYSGLHTFLSAPKHRRDLILSQRMPEVNASVGIKGDYGSFNELVLRAKQAEDMFLIIGPPGTGKTSYGLLNLLQEELLEEGHNILLLSYTNRAVDEICSKLVESGIDFIRIGADLSCSPEYRGNLFVNKTRNCKKGSEVKALIAGTRVFCGTTAALNSNTALFKIKSFDLAIVDESSQILEPSLVGLLGIASDGKCAIRKFVLIGDHKQLPAVVQQTVEISEVTDPLLLDINLTDCRLSLFERLLAQFRIAPDTYMPEHVYMLSKQGRMHREIAEFPNEAFYGGKLDIVPLEHQALELNAGNDVSDPVERMLSSRRVVFIPAKAPADSLSDKVNTVEAELIARIVLKVYELNKERFESEKTIGVIVPYRNQISTVRNAIDAFGIECLHDITIDTVERYQGSQRDFIIYGFTIQRLYQLNFLTDSTFVEDGKLIDRKLNVAMTRARLHLIIIGNPDILEHNSLYKDLIDRYCYPSPL